MIGMSEQDYEDMFEMRKIYEIQAVKWAIERITEEEMDRLEETFYEFMEFYTLRKDIDKMLTINTSDSSGHFTKENPITECFANCCPRTRAFSSTRVLKRFMKTIIFRPFSKNTATSLKPSRTKTSKPALWQWRITSIVQRSGAADFRRASRFGMQ